MLQPRTARRPRRWAPSLEALRLGPDELRAAWCLIRTRIPKTMWAIMTWAWHCCGSCALRLPCAARLTCLWALSGEARHVSAGRNLGFLGFYGFRIWDFRDCLLAQVAINWCMGQGTIPIPGAKTLANARDNLGALGWRLSADELGALSEAADAAPRGMIQNIFQTG